MSWIPKESEGVPLLVRPLKPDVKTRLIFIVLQTRALIEMGMNMTLEEMRRETDWLEGKSTRQGVKREPVNWRFKTVIDTRGKFSVTSCLQELTKDVTDFILYKRYRHPERRQRRS